MKTNNPIVINDARAKPDKTQRHSLANKISDGDDDENSYYKTCCGSVQTLAASSKFFPASVISAIFYTAILYKILKEEILKEPQAPLRRDNSTAASLAFFVIFPLVMCTFICNFVANIKRIACLYWPFLIMNALWVVAGVVAGIYLIIKIANWSLEDGVEYYGGFLLIDIISLMFLCWMEMVVYKAYRYMIDGKNRNIAVE